MKRILLALAVFVGSGITAWASWPTATAEEKYPATTKYPTFPVYPQGGEPSWAINPA